MNAFTLLQSTTLSLLQRKQVNDDESEEGSSADEDGSTPAAPEKEEVQKPATEAVIAGISEDVEDPHDACDMNAKDPDNALDKVVGDSQAVLDVVEKPHNVPDVTEDPHDLDRAVEDSGVVPDGTKDEVTKDKNGKADEQDVEEDISSASVLEESSAPTHIEEKKVAAPASATEQKVTDFQQENVEKSNSGSEDEELFEGEGPPEIEEESEKGSSSDFVVVNTENDNSRQTGTTTLSKCCPLNLFSLLRKSRGLHPKKFSIDFTTVSYTC